MTGPTLLDRPAYMVEGEHIGVGSDGEPLVRPSKTTPLTGQTINFPVIGEIEAK
jgi:hypothetical protein